MTDVLELVPPDEAEPLGTTQWKLTTIQMLNWGTFHGYHRIEVSPFGHLITGESGKGKSTILDVIPAVMVPPKDHDFNAAARDAITKGRDRDTYSYTRGAHGQEMDQNGTVKTLYLRGTDKVQWSAVSLTFQHPDRGAVSLVRVFRLPESATDAEGVARAAMIVERDFHLREELRDIVPHRLDVGVLKRTFAPRHVSTDFTSFQERYMRTLGLTERSLMLLQKIQAMKGLNNLDNLMREFMLDEPATFEYRDAAVANFRNLRAVHESVVTARAQRDMLAPLPGLVQVIADATDQNAQRRIERDGLDRVHVQLRAQIIAAELTAAEEALRESTAALDVVTALVADTDRQVNQLQSQLDAGTGGRVTAMKALIDAAEQELLERSTGWAGFTGLLDQLGLETPTTRAGFDELFTSVHVEVARLQQESADTKDARHAAAENVGQFRKARDDAKREQDSLQRRGKSNVPDEQDRIRNEVANALQVPYSALPFAAELMDVTAREKEWQGPIERVLRPLALSMIVEDHLYAEANRYINSHNLRGKIEYIRADAAVLPSHLTAEASSVISKLDLVDSPLRNWLLRRLHRFFDYKCVESLEGIPTEMLAVTRSGLVRSKNDRHVKDDRTSVNNRKLWILGPDSSSKLDEFTAEVSRLSDELDAALSVRDGMDADQHARGQRTGDLRRVLDTRWDAVDMAAAAEKVEHLHRSRQLLLDADPGMQRANDELSQLRKALAEVRERQVKVSGAYGAAEGTVNRLRGSLADEEARLSRHEPIYSEVEAMIHARLTAINGVTTRQLDDDVNDVRSEIDKEIQAALDDRGAAERTMLKAFASFKLNWGEMATEADETLASLPEYLAILRRIEDDRLPDFEKDFLNLMQEGAHKHLTDLYRAFEEERKAIHRRIDPINDVLDTTEYNAGTTLRIDVNDVPPDAVVTFKRMLQEFTGMSVYPSPETAEKRYGMLAEIMKLLDGDDQRWQREVLDVRRHVEFVAKEMRSGKAVDWFTSSNGRSGGQRVKFVTFTLAAALKYQLTDDLSELPVFAPVIIDEAFAKADADFTRQSLQVFQAFGFQLILATPNNKLKTFQQFVGGATVVYRSDETQKSRLKTVAIGEHTDLDDSTESWA